jgi:predicted PhzF superfamily epimerase YddE/YHI9
MENALSETSFMTCIDKEKLRFTLRWFSPIVEIDLCGHATLASAHYLKSLGLVPPGEEKTIFFETRRSGILTATCKLNGEIELSFPSSPPSNINLSEFDKLEVIFLALPGLLATEVIHLGKTNQNDLFLEISPDRFLSLLQEEIKFGSIRELGGRGLILSCLGSKHSPLAIPTDSKYDFLSRFFAPRVGVDEDPATGSAHCCLGPHFTRRIFGDRANVGKRLLGCQMSKRGAELGVMAVDERVKLFGYCATIIESTIC